MFFLIMVKWHFGIFYNIYFIELSLIKNKYIHFAKMPKMPEKKTKP